MAKMSESRGSASPRSVLARIQELRGLARDGERADLDLTPPSLEELLRHTRRQLIECARCVGLTGAQRLTKAALATRVQQELERIAILAGAQEPADASRKFDLGFTFRRGRPVRGHPVGLWAGPGDGDGRRAREALRLLGGDRQGARAGAGRARARRPRCLVQLAGLRRHEPHLRRHQRPSLLRSLGLADRPAVVLLHRPAVVHGDRRGRSQVGGGLLRPRRAVRPGGLPAPRAGVSRPRGMAHGALGQRRGGRAGHRHRRNARPRPRQRRTDRPARGSSGVGHPSDPRGLGR